MNKVLILMSTYNGGIKIKKQVESILNQRDVLVNILIRDDGSDIETKSILQDIEKKNGRKVHVEFSLNIGWKKSFHSLLQSKYAHGYDYYGFSDQDDVWMSDKLISCINLMEKDPWQGPKLAHCNILSVDKLMNVRKEQEQCIARPLNHKNAFATEYFQGCSMVWNQSCMDLVQSYRVKNKNISHDYWMGLIGYLFGRVYFCQSPKQYHIRYGNNESSDGNVKKGRLRRIGSLLKNKTPYMNPSRDLLDGYSDLLTVTDKKFLKMLRRYRENFRFKMFIILDRRFKRPSILSTMLLKFAILINRY